MLKERMEEAEKRRRLAEVRAAKRAEKKRIERAKEISAMDLPVDYVNHFKECHRRFFPR